MLIYFAGHGFVDRTTGKGYLAPYDIDRDNIGATGLPMDELGQAIGGKIHAKSKILLTDACHSGAITPEDTQSLNQKLAELEHVAVLADGQPRSRAVIRRPGLRRRPRRVHLLRGEGHGRAGRSHPRDGKVTADELAEYVHTQVREATNGQQNPTSDKGSFDPNMFLAYVPANAPPGARRAPKSAPWSSNPTWTM